MRKLWVISAVALLVTSAMVWAGDAEKCGAVCQLFEVNPLHFMHHLRLETEKAESEGKITQLQAFRIQRRVMVAAYPASGQTTETLPLYGARMKRAWAENGQDRDFYTSAGLRCAEDMEDWEGSMTNQKWAKMVEDLQ